MKNMSSKVGEKVLSTAETSLVKPQPVQGSKTKVSGKINNNGGSSLERPDLRASDVSNASSPESSTIQIRKSELPRPKSSLSMAPSALMTPPSLGSPARPKSPVRPSTPSLLGRLGTPLTSPARPSTPSKNSPHVSNSGNVRVVVRVRPFVEREVQQGKQSIIHISSAEQSVDIIKPATYENSSNHSLGPKRLETKHFFFDHALCSLDSSAPDYADQETVYTAIGKEFLDHNLEGYHTCIFAYGQTGSGKSYTMMGDADSPGIIPRTCQDLFDKMNKLSTPNYTFAVRISFFEIYNEQVRDLLSIRSNNFSAKLRVRESPTEGPYIENLTEYTVKDASQVIKHLQDGNKLRTTASTKVNDQSSRSHAVFTLVVKQTRYDAYNQSTEERISRIRLVDLAGSERADATGASGDRLKEGSNINKSLTTLGRVIAILSSGNSKSVIPYRDSTLTWLLKDSLGGNSKTAMIACISPTDYEESLSTLRYANQAKKITTQAIINQDIISSEARDKLVEEMQQEINNLQLSLQEYSSHQAENDKFQHELAKIKQAIRYYEDRAIMEENKRLAIQQENAALHRHNNLLRGQLKEVTNQNVGLYSLDEALVRSYDSLKEEHESIVSDFRAFRSRLKVSKENFSHWLAVS